MVAEKSFCQLGLFLFRRPRKKSYVGLYYKPIFFFRLEKSGSAIPARVSNELSITWLLLTQLHFPCLCSGWMQLAFCKGHFGKNVFSKILTNCFRLIKLLYNHIYLLERAVGSISWCSKNFIRSRWQKCLSVCWKKHKKEGKNNHFLVTS